METTRTDGIEGRDSGGFSYFMIRTARDPASAELHGIVERLGTGEKRAFASGDELLSLVRRWPGAPVSGHPHQEDDSCGTA